MTVMTTTSPTPTEPPTELPVERVGEFAAGWLATPVGRAVLPALNHHGTTFAARLAAAALLDPTIHVLCIDPRKDNPS